MADREMSDGVAEADSQLSKSTTGIKKSSRIPVPGGATISTPAQTPGLAFASTPHVSLLPRTPAPATAEDPTATPGSTTPSPGALSNGTSNNASSPSIGMPVPGGQAPDTPLPAAPTSGIPASGIPTFATPSSSRIPVVPSTPFLASSMSLRGPRTSTGGLLTRASSNGASSILGGSSTAIPSPPSPHPSITPPSAPPPPSSLFKRISAGASYTPGGTSTAIPSPPSSHSSIAPPSLTLPPYSPSPSSPTPSALGITIGSPGLASRTSGQTAWQLSPTSKPSPRLASNAFPSPPSSIGIPRPPPSIDYSAISQLDTHTIRGNQSVYNTTNAGADNKPTSAGIRVSVRLRPLSEKERVRGDKELWAIDEDANIGFYQGRDRKFVPKHRYNTVFGPTSSNYEVFDTIGRPLVLPSLAGFNGTIFAYGVTSSGKTHTMMGDVAAAFGDNGQPGIPAGGQPGITPLMVKQLFDSFAAESREFSVKLSMMEIYNEVLNDLLDPTRQNLKVYEDHTRGVVVESLSEEPVYSAEEALFLIQTGETNRKVSCTAFNEDSSRSHTICRLLIEGRDEPATANSSRDDLPSGPNSVRSSCAGEQDPVRRSGALPSFRPPAAAATGAVTTSVLSLIDLAGSESAKVSLSKGQRIEGSFINKSLLTLGTVINKLAQGQATHIPFRDSKLTRLLQNSLSGKGARIALICNITPATAQGEETANTLKFATRAKLVRISLSKNETIDEKGLLRRYAVEIQELRMQLILLQSSMTSPAMDSESDLEGLTSVSEAGGYSGSEVGAAIPGSELESLRRRLDAERQAHIRCKQEKALLEVRMIGLVHQLTDKRVTKRESTEDMNGYHAPWKDLRLEVDTLGGAGKPARVSETSSSIFETPQPSPSSWLDMDQPARRDEGGAPISPHLFPVPETSELLTGNAPGGCVAAADSHASGGDEGNLPMGTQAGGDGLDNYGMHSNRGRHQGMSGPGSCIVEDTDLKDLEIQVLLAEREVLQDQIVSVELVNERLESEGMQWQMQAQEYSVEREKTLRILHELESDMSELRRLKNQSQAELNALRLETLTLGKADTGQGASLQRRIPSSSGASS